MITFPPSSFISVPPYALVILVKVIAPEISQAVLALLAPFPLPGMLFLQGHRARPSRGQFLLISPQCVAVVKNKGSKVSCPQTLLPLFVVFWRKSDFISSYNKMWLLIGVL